MTNVFDLGALWKLFDGTQIAATSRGGVCKVFVLTGR